PNASARRIRDAIIKSTEVNHIAVIISDTFGRPWREGHLNFAIGTAGIKPLQDYRDTVDAVGKIMRVTMTATVDIVAAAADLVSGKATNTPVSIVRGLNYEPSGEGMEGLLRAAEKDMFR
ncbi:MAG: coenzyme F420-0:L-glutamate ligase, partial [Chloroflexota bacterium]|nr:coenzyme F420-0:L-glutamate ligase [Chloroflexota bacterium]